MTGTSPAPRAMRTRPAPACPLCGGAGTTLYDTLEDRLFGAPGVWRMTRCGDAACGLLWLDPAPTPEDLPLAYAAYHTHARTDRRRSAAEQALRRWIKDGYYADRFGYAVRGAGIKRLLARAFVRSAKMRDDLDRLVMLLPPVPGGRAVDVGAGDGKVVEELRALGWDAEGVDFDPAAVDGAKARGLPIRLGSLADQRYPAGRFEAVTMSHVIEHVSDPLALLIEARRVLSPSGRLVLATPNALGLGHRRFGPAWRGLEPPRHLQVFTPEALSRALDRAGLRAIELKSVAGGAAFIAAESRRIRGETAARADDAAALEFAREAAAAIGSDPWAGEELLVIATPP